jgi:hypothetical protein
MDGKVEKSHPNGAPGHKLHAVMSCVGDNARVAEEAPASLHTNRVRFARTVEVNIVAASDD